LLSEVKREWNVKVSFCSQRPDLGVFSVSSLATHPNIPSQKWWREEKGLFNTAAGRGRVSISAHFPGTDISVRFELRKNWAGDERHAQLSSPGEIVGWLIRINQFPRDDCCCLGWISSWGICLQDSANLGI
jgi:hypothetical protein